MNPPGTSGRDEGQEQVDLSPPSRCGHVHTGGTWACSHELLSQSCWRLAEVSRVDLHEQVLSWLARQRRGSSAPPTEQHEADPQAQEAAEDWVGEAAVPVGPVHAAPTSA